MGVGMACIPIFLSVVIVSRNADSSLTAMLADATRAVADMAQDFELVVVDNASDDDSVAALRKLAGDGGLPNLQVFALTKQVDVDTASWVGLESALGDFVAVFDPSSDDIGFLATMLERAVAGADVVFASNRQKPRRSFAYRIGAAVFDIIYKWFNGIRLAREAPQFRVLSRRVVNFILQHPRPEIAYRHLPATGGWLWLVRTLAHEQATTIGQADDPQGLRKRVLERPCLAGIAWASGHGPSLQPSTPRRRDRPAPDGQRV